MDKYKKVVRKSRVELLGRVIDPSGAQPGSLFLINRARDGRRIACDALGSFRIDLNERRKVKLDIERDGVVVSQIELDPLTFAGEFLIEISPRPVVLEDPVSIMIRASRPPLLKEGVLNRLRTLPTRIEVEEQSIGEVERMLDELQELSDLALPALRGDAGALSQLRGAFELEVPFDFELDLGRFKPAPTDFGIDPCQVVPSAPWAVVMAGIMMDAGEGNKWAGKAVSAILRRSEPAARVARALSGFEIGQVGNDLLRDTLSLAADVAGPTPSQTPVWELLRDRSLLPSARPSFQSLSRPFDLANDFGSVFGGGFGVRPVGPRFATLLDVCNLEWLECAHTFVTSPPPKTGNPPAVGKVEPTDILAGQATQIKLFPPPGGSFGTTQHPGWVIELGTDAIVPSSWATSEIVLDVPALPPGCYVLRWIVDQSQGAEFFNQQTAACARFFGDRPLIRPFIPFPIGQVSVVGQPSIVFFTADKVGGQLNAEGCTAVEIGWRLDRLVCSGSTATWAVDVTDDAGAVLFQGVTTEDKISVTSAEDRLYTLTARNSLGGVASPPAVATLRVERYQRLTAIRKVSPGGLVKAGSLVTIEVEISCPADDPAVVVVSSDHPNRCPGLAITVPVGQTKATGQVNAGTATGRVTLSGAVSGVNQTPAREAFVVHNPTFDTLIASSLEQCDGGFVKLRVRSVTSVSAVGLSGPGGFVPSNPSLEMTPSVPSDPASGTLDVTARFGPLASGTYALEAQADGVMLAGGQVVCALGNPSVSTPSATPNVVPVCISTQVTLSATARRATELLITRIDGTVVGGPVQGTNPCGSLSLTATVQLTGKGTFRAVAKRPGAPSATADVTVGESFSHTAAVLVLVYGRTKNPDGTFISLYLYVASLQADGKLTAPRKLATLANLNERFAYTPQQCEVFQIWAFSEDNPEALMDTNKVLYDSNLLVGHPSGAWLSSFV